MSPPKGMAEGPGDKAQARREPNPQGVAAVGRPIYSPVGPRGIRTTDFMSDPVNPEHYKTGIECIDAIRASLGDQGFLAYCRGNAMKYLWRAEKKGGVEDLQKARWYLQMMLSLTAEGEKDPRCQP